ncbi:hypothetical protein KSP39_PZI023122 [Platanthera zijinensis]|uniref:Uncharacterized protein n=1 Tax=Platanthera zijinensis TaxID=2320716 RepID=A0AAP0FVL4_9ASPA
MGIYSTSSVEPNPRTTRTRNLFRVGLTRVRTYYKITNILYIVHFLLLELIFKTCRSCPIDLKEAISSVIFASPRCADLPELVDVRKHFTAKYEKDFITSTLELRPDCGVNLMIVEKLSAKAPNTETKIKILTEIAKEHDVKWDPKAVEEELQNSNDLFVSNSDADFISYKS